MTRTTAGLGPHDFARREPKQFTGTRSPRRDCQVTTAIGKGLTRGRDLALVPQIRRPFAEHLKATVVFIQDRHDDIA